MRGLPLRERVAARTHLRPRDPARLATGFSLLELLVTVVLAGLVAGALFDLLRGQERLARVQADAVTAAEVLRLSAAIVAGELRLLDPAEDLALATPESLAVRAFRAFAVVCGATPAGALVRRRGLRAADPTKDSVLLVGQASPATAFGLAGAAAAPGACPAAPGEQVELWVLGGGTIPPVGSALLLYEAGTYSLSGAALRYRRGNGGRQPLSAAWIDDAASGFQVRNAAGGGAAYPAEATAIIARIAVAAPQSGGAGQRRTARLFLALMNGAAAGGPP